MSTEDTPKPAAWTFGSSYWTRAESIPLAIIAQAEPLFDQATIDAAVAAANARWECALGAVMPADFKCWHQNEKSELPEIAAGVIENLRQQAADAWEQGAAAVAKERERLLMLVEAVRDANCDAEDVNTFRLLKPGQERAWLALMAGLKG